jgi:ERCC4-type nuclease
MGYSVELCPLDYADCAFVGNGPNGVPVGVGIELKKLKDMLSCITTGRFSGHQLPGLVQNYDEVWLIVEGIYRPSPKDGVLETLYGRSWETVRLGARAWMYRDFESFLTTMEVKGGIRIRRTTSRDETARVVGALYSWWCNSDYDEHRAHLTFNRARDQALLAPPSLKHEIAACLPGLGYMKGGAAAGHFDSVQAMILADEKEWMKVPGIGKGLAKKIVEAVQ